MQMPECPDCRKTFDDGHALASHHGQVHDTDLPDGIDTSMNLSDEKWEEIGQKISDANSGENHWAYGLTGSDHPVSGQSWEWSEESKQKLSESLTGHPALKQSPSEETRRKMSEANRGENHYAWKGGVREGYPKEYNRVRDSVVQRDGEKCFLCGIPQSVALLDVHHVDGDRYNNELSNLLTLCRKCHRRIETSLYGGDFGCAES